MTRPYKLTSNPISPLSPLHWTRFWPDLQRIHRGRVEARQNLILWLANAWIGAVDSSKTLPYGFRAIQMRLSDLRDMVRDYQNVFEVFFTVQRKGFNISEEKHEVSTVVPNKLPSDLENAVRVSARHLRYDPPELPADDTVISKVYLQPNIDRATIVERVLEAGRPELVPQLLWLLKQRSPELNFHFVPSGKLQQRDTSVWPIAAIETWPGWLREELFGPGIDLDAAYIQFLMQYVKDLNPSTKAVLFPDFGRLIDDKENFRRELCEEVMGLPYNADGKTLTKQIIMSLANGSRISPRLLLCGSGFSAAADLILGNMPDVANERLEKIGARLKRLSDQFEAARKYAAIEIHGVAPTRATVKTVFTHYFMWERQARYALWEAVGRHGIMVHDGLDGVPQEYLSQIDTLVSELNLKLTA